MAIFPLCQFWWHKVPDKHLLNFFSSFFLKKQNWCLDEANAQKIEMVLHSNGKKPFFAHLVQKRGKAKLLQSQKGITGVEMGKSPDLKALSRGKVDNESQGSRKN